METRLTVCERSRLVAMIIIIMTYKVHWAWSYDEVSSQKDQKDL